MTMKKPTTKKAQTTEGKAVVYIGPTLGGGALMRSVCGSCVGWWMSCSGPWVMTLWQLDA